MIKILIGIALGFIIGWLLTMSHYENRYVKLRSEIILATGTDISYPHKDDEQKLNNSWFHR